MAPNNSLALRLVDQDLSIDPAAAVALESGRVGDPFSLLGPQPDGRGGVVVRAYLPPAEAVDLVDAQDRVLAAMQPIEPAGLFAARIGGRTSYRLRIHWPGGVVQTQRGSVCLRAAARRDGSSICSPRATPRAGPLSGCAGDEHRGRRGRALCGLGAERAARVGGRRFQRLGRPAPRDAQARRGGRVGAVHSRVCRQAPSTSTRFSGPHGLLPLKADPVALQVEPPPRTASIVADPTPSHGPTRHGSRHARAPAHSPHAPLSIYEVHAGSWRRTGRRRAARLGRAGRAADSVCRRTRLHAHRAAARHGAPVRRLLGLSGARPVCAAGPVSASPPAFARFVDRCHDAGVGVILDWVPGHFPTDTARAGRLRRHGTVRARRSARGVSPGVEYRGLQFRPPRSARRS